MINYKEIGLKCGLELHQMLDTSTKLFCKCPPEIRHEDPEFTFKRRLRPTRSEIGEIDPAALFEFKKGRTYLYEGYEDNVCLVEMDEEPPHDLNREALQIALEISLLLNAKPVDEIHVMRKIVIDGSNTTGFQRTALISINGCIEVNGKKVPIQTICLEEDAARKIGEKEGGRVVVYRLDRLGIPLIEIATAPVINTPDEAYEVARYIGRLLRITGKVKRGLGTIRQDLNISIKGGARVEIKGVQKLELLPKIVEYEALRQLRLLELKKELEKRGVKEDDISYSFIDVTDIFANSKSKIVSRALKSEGIGLAVKVPGFAGLIGCELQPGRRFGTELADYVRFWSGLRGIFHSDELPAYGISEEEVEKVRRRLNMNERDAFILAFGPAEDCRNALKAVVDRIKVALRGVPEETRGANDDGTTKFLRPMPGRARMYPETDIRPIRIDDKLLETLRAKLPETPEKKLKRFVEEYGLSRELAEKILDSKFLQVFEALVREVKVPPVLIASTLTNTLVELRREGLDTESLSQSKLWELFRAVEAGTLSKEAVPEVLREMLKQPEESVTDIIERIGLKSLSEDEARRIVNEVINSSSEKLLSMNEKKAINFIMGRAMSKLRGRIDGRKVYKIVSEEVSKFFKEHGKS